MVMRVKRDEGQTEGLFPTHELGVERGERGEARSGSH